MRKSVPINLIVHYPKTEKGWRELKRRIAEIHADAIFSTINKLDCPKWQKAELLEAVIAEVKKDIEAEGRGEMVVREREKIAQSVDFIVNGYAFACRDGKVFVVNMNRLSKNTLLDENGAVIKSSMDPIEISIIQGYWEKNKQFAKE